VKLDVDLPWLLSMLAEEYPAADRAAGAKDAREQSAGIKMSSAASDDDDDDRLRSDQILTAFAEEFRRVKRSADRGLAQLDDRDFFFKLSDRQKQHLRHHEHMAGNMRSRWTDFLTTDGDKPGRDAEGEFVDNPAMPREKILRMWEEGLGHFVSRPRRYARRRSGPNRKDSRRSDDRRRRDRAAIRALRLARWADTAARKAHSW